MKIPQKVFYTFYTNKIWDTEIGTTMKTDIKNNPEFTFEFYNDDDCLLFIRKNFDERVLIAFQQLIPGAYKADLVRLLLLYVYGGVYIDVGHYLAVPLQDILGDHELVLTEDLDLRYGHGKHLGIYNAFIASIPKHAFIRECIDIIVNQVHNLNYGMSCWDITGPHILGKVYKKYYPLKEGIHDNGKLKMIAFKKFDTRDIFFGNQILIYDKNRIPNRHKILASIEKTIDSSGNHYSNLYNIKKVFHCLTFGTWYNSARNYRIYDGKIFAELRNCRDQWILDSAPIDKNQQYENIDGRFVLQL